jgi:hypothetical protein
MWEADLKLQEYIIYGLNLDFIIQKRPAFLDSVQKEMLYEK